MACLPPAPAYGGCGDGGGGYHCVMCSSLVHVVVGYPEKLYWWGVVILRAWDQIGGQGGVEGQNRHCPDEVPTCFALDLKQMYHFLSTMAAVRPLCRLHPRGPASQFIP